MKRIGTALKLAGLMGALTLAMVLFASCGADVDTQMTIDSDFSGTREIVVTLDDTYITEYVTGGYDTIQAAVDENLPAQMTYTKTEEQPITYVFAMRFTDINDYKAQVDALLALDPESDIVPEIVFDAQQSDFKNGLQFYENFTSADLMGWLMAAIEAKDAVTYDSGRSSWYNIGDVILNFDGQTYEGYYSNFNVDEMQSAYLSQIEVSTWMLADGGYERDIAFYASEWALEDLQNVGMDLEAYLTGLMPAGAELTVSDDDSYTGYHVRFAASDVDALNEATNTLLQSDNSSFAITYAPSDIHPGTVDVVVEEMLDGSYYLDLSSYSYSMSSRLFMLPGSEAKEDSPTVAYRSYSYDDEDEATHIYYNFSEPGVASQVWLTWQISYEEVTLEYTLSDKVGAHLLLSAPQNGPEELASLYKESLEACLPEGVTLAENSTTIQSEDGPTLEFTVFDLDFGTGSDDEIADLLNAFMVNYTSGMQYVSEYNFYLAYYESYTTASNPFQKAYSVYGSANFSSISSTGEGQIVLNGGGLYKIIDNGAKEDTVVLTSEQGYVNSFEYEVVGTNLILIIIIVAGVLLLAAAAVVIILFIKKRTKSSPTPNGGYALPQDNMMPYPPAPLPMQQPQPTDELPGMPANSQPYAPADIQTTPTAPQVAAPAAADIQTAPTAAPPAALQPEVPAPANNTEQPAAPPAEPDNQMGQP